MSIRPQENSRFYGKLPFASEVLGDELSDAPFVSQTINEPAPAESPIEVHAPTSLHGTPTIYDLPKQQILDTHYETLARADEKLIQNSASQSIDLTSNSFAKEAGQTRRMDADEAPSEQISEDEIHQSPADVKEHPSLLHFLLGFLPGASVPKTWRPAGTLVVMALIIFMGWHVINGKDGLSIWQQKRAEDRRLQQEIDRLKQENSQVRDHITSLNTDKDAIEREAREKLHYARTGEIIYALPEKTTAATQAK